jgi:hypothetical protein
MIFCASSSIEYNDNSDQKLTAGRTSNRFPHTQSESLCTRRRIPIRDSSSYINQHQILSGNHCNELTGREPKRQISPNTPSPILQLQGPDVIIVQPHVLTTNILGAFSRPEALLESANHTAGHCELSHTRMCKAG